MVVLGGRSDPDEFSSDVLLYQVNCNAWLLPDLTRESPALSLKVPGLPTGRPLGSSGPPAILLHSLNGLRTMEMLSSPLYVSEVDKKRVPNL